MSVTILSAPESKRNNLKVAKYLQQINHDGLFLPFPKETMEFIVQLCEGLPYNYLISELKRTLEPVLEPIDPWEESFEPLLKALSQVKATNPNVEPYCYRDSFYTHFRTKFSGDLAVLTFKVTVTGEVNTEEWRKVLQEDQKYRQDALQREMDFIVLKAGKHEQSVCVSSSGEYFASQLQKEGYSTTLISIGPHPSIPIEKLEGEIDQGNISDENIKELVLLHICYIQKYVLSSRNLEEAKYRWEIRKNPLKMLLFKLKELSKNF